MAGLDATTAMDFSVGTTEQKMDMSLDDIIKQSKKASAKTRVPIKGRNKKLNGPVVKAALQKSVASRSSGMRQGKFAEARARNGDANFPATQAASKKAFAAPINTRSRQIMKNTNHVVGRPAFARDRNFQKGPFIPAAARNMTMSVINNASKVGAGNPRRRNGAVAPAAVVRQVSADTRSNGANHFQPQAQRPKTLDSLFASIRNAPQQAAPKFVAQQAAPKFVAQQAAPKFVAQQGGRRRGGFVGGRGRGQQNGVRMPYV